MNLDVKKWKEFRFGNLISNIYKAPCINKDDLSVADTPGSAIRYITRTGEDNGCEMIADSTCISPSDIEEGNAITIGDTTATCFYQPERFIAGDHIVVVRADNWLNPHTAMFILSVLNNERYKYSYGRPFVKEHIEDTFLPLPTDKNGNPDWAFIEAYIKSLKYRPLTTKNRNEAHALGIANWEEFRVAKILTILNGKGITKEEIDDNPGSFTVVQSGEENNGVLGMIDKDYCVSMNYAISNKPCLTVARSGSAGFVSFQVDGCVVGDSAKILLLSDDIATTPIYLFVQTVLSANRFKYAYGRKVTKDKYMNDVIVLPVCRNSDGSPVIDKAKRFSVKGYVPDWQFMDKYIRSLPYGDRL